MEIELSWDEIYRIAETIPFQYYETSKKYHLFKVNGGITFYTSLQKGSSEASEFESGYKDNANKPIADVPIPIQLKMARYKISSDLVGLVSLEFQIPSPQRVMFGGFAWFDGYHLDDHIAEIAVIDRDGIVAPPGTNLGFFTDPDVPPDNRGWFVDKNKEIEMPSIGGGETGLGGLYISMKAQTGDNRPDNFRVNVRWGKKS